MTAPIPQDKKSEKSACLVDRSTYVAHYTTKSRRTARCLRRPGASIPGKVGDPCVKHVFADQKSRMGLYTHTVGISRAEMKMVPSNLVYNIRRFISLERVSPA